ncbi:MAG: VOC family protein [Hydrogenophaga sp.]|nr:VOC family protein [Hydrogenophaga sp.]
MSHMNPNDIRTLFSRAMSDLYRTEVPQYGTLCDLVNQVNDAELARNSQLARSLRRGGQLDRLEVERHGAIRVGTAEELSTIRRLFALMGMMPVGYYDLSVAGVPVHATAFRPVNDASLDHNPFRVFTSLLRLELISDVDLRERAQEILSRRKIFTARCLALLEQGEKQGGLGGEDAREFVSELLQTFKWHQEATVDLETFRRLRAAHALVADIVCFKGPHINHLTPRTLDIDLVQEGMSNAGLSAKEVIEGPPRREFPILLRQTSFLALEEPIRFLGQSGDGTHTARFGEVEQRGCALTRSGRALYDDLLAKARSTTAGSRPSSSALDIAFSEFPDDAKELFERGLAFFRFEVAQARVSEEMPPTGASSQSLVAGGWLTLTPITYEDFLPVSAAGIFRSNLGGEVRSGYESAGHQRDFESALGATVIDEISLYEATQSASLAACERRLKTECPAWSA